MSGNILVSVQGWDADTWRAEFVKAAPSRIIFVDPEGAADPSVRYAAVWKQRPSSLAKLPNLKVIFSLGAGVDHVFQDPDLPSVPIVRVVSDDLTMRMSEYIIWQVLDHHRLGPKYRRQQRNHIWLEERAQPAAHQVTVGFLGLGVLGSDAARKLALLGFNVTGWSRKPRYSQNITCFNGEEQLPWFLATVDILVCLLPLTPQTRGFLNKGLFDRMKKGGTFGAPILINAGRGGLQNEKDILQALEDGVLSAASLDVFNTEPLPTQSPFWTHPKVTITPHAAASSAPDQLVGPIVAQIEAFERGEPLRNTVSRVAQY
jgi:glyoxylate/hydroxypyruvate reductase